MPRGDRTGPNGMGPMTGRSLGYCNDYASPGFTKGAQRGGAGFNYGRGLRRGFCRGFGYDRGFQYPAYTAPQYSAKDETKYLETEIDALKNELTAMEKHLSELEKEEK